MFFDDSDDILEESEETLEKYIDKSNDIFERNIGDIVYYDKTKDEFNACPLKYYSPNESYITMGIVVNQYEDFSIDVMTKGFLTEKSIRTPLSYMSPERLSFIGPYIYDKFKRYRSALSKQCPKYELIQKILFRMPTILHLNNIIENKDSVTNSLETIMGHDEAHKFMLRLYYTKVYVIYDKKLYAWQATSENKFKIHNVNILQGDFLTIFTLYL